jgi:hypothetical protein
MPTATPTSTSTPKPTSIPKSSVVSALLKNGFEPCWKMGFGIDDGAFKDYDGSLILTRAGYVDKFNIIKEVYENDIRSWFDDSFKIIEGGTQESDVGNYHLVLFIGEESQAIPGSWVTLLNLIVEIVPLGTESHLVK